MPTLRYTREILEAAVRDSRSISDVMRTLGLRLSGGGHAHVKRRLVYFQIDTSHFLGARANSGSEHRGGPARKLPHERLWNGKPLVLQVDHDVNGLHHDYRPENLRFLCPNCHSQTLNFAVRNHAYAEVVKRQTRKS